MSFKVLSLGYDKDLLVQGSVSWKRHVRYASVFDELHAVIFTRKGVINTRVKIAENAWAYPTCSSSRPSALLDAYRILRSIMRESGPWVLSAQDPFESGLLAYVLSRITGTPFLVQEHGDFFSLSDWRRESILNRVRYLCGRFVIHRAHRVRVVAKRIARTLEDLNVPREKITIVPVHVDTAAFAEAKLDVSIDKLRPEDGVLILTMARMVPQKNLALLIDAFREVVRNGVRAHLVILGKGPEKEALLSRAHGLVPEHLTFLDWTDDPAGAMRAADIYALSSNYEGWGRVCIEALAAGTPLVMTDVGCAGEVVRDGENGLVVPVGDASAFARALARLATDRALRERLARSGTETVRLLPTPDDYIATYKKSLECCIVPSHEGS